MCGRYTLVTDQTALERYYKKQMSARYRGPSYNVAPTQSVPIITAEGIEPMRWGLVPQWAKSLNTGYSMINAKAETLTEKRTYSKLLDHQRCLVPASGFYEWLGEAGHKIPHYFTVKDRQLFSFAGLYEIRKDSEEFESKSFTIITTAANNLVQPIHDRMPVILTPEEEKDWLNPKATDPTELLPMLDSYPADQMRVQIVSSLVSNTRNNSPELIDPVDQTGERSSSE